MCTRNAKRGSDDTSSNPGDPPVFARSLAWNLTLQCLQDLWHGTCRIVAQNETGTMQGVVGILVRFQQVLTRLRDKYRRTGFNCENLIFANFSRVRKLLICKEYAYIFIKLSMT